MENDQLIARLITLCRRFNADDPLQGRHAIANKAGLSEQYLYQIISGKTMANGNTRSLGKIARAKISKAFPDWLDAPNGATAGNVTQQNIASYQAKPHHDRSMVQKICDLSERLDDTGLTKLYGFACCLLAEHELVKAKPPLSA